MLDHAINDTLQIYLDQLKARKNGLITDLIRISTDLYWRFKSTLEVKSKTRFMGEKVSINST